MLEKDWGIYWDNSNNIPIILNKDLESIRIKSESLLEIAQDLRPVFL